jgi:hypothetical protein
VLEKQDPGEAVQPSFQWIFAPALVGALALMVSVGCVQRAGSPPITWEDAQQRQVELDVAAIVAGMTQAHGAREVALMPEWLQELLSRP